MSTTEAQQRHIRIGAWNSRGLVAAGPYISRLMDSSDVMCISEHQLYECELNRLNELSPDYIGYGKSSTSLKPENHGKVPGHCGVAILWRKSMATHVRPLNNLGTDRMCAIEVTLPRSRTLYIVSVYMPQQGCRIADYDTHMDALESCMTQWSGDVVIMGDVNAHFGPDFGYRGWGRTSKNASCVSEMMERQGAVIWDVSVNCDGPSYTYCSSSGATSYIDHAIVSKSLSDCIRYCRVLPDELCNTSDHLAMSLELEVKVSVHTCEDPSGNTCTSWHKLSADRIFEQYTHPLEQTAMRYVPHDNKPEDIVHWSHTDIDSATQDIIFMTKQSCSRISKSKSSKYQKPYWRKELKELSVAKETAWREWVACGKPKSNDSDAWNTYQQAKKTFRREQRRAVVAKEEEYVKEMEQQASIDQRAFWSLVNRRYKPRSAGPGLKPFTDSNGRTLTDIDAIAEGWREYFGGLYTPKSQPHYDKTFKDNIEQRFSEILCSDEARSRPSLLSHRISTEDVVKVCKKLKTGKAPGADGMKPEELKYAGSVFLSLVARLFNAIVHHEYRPACLKRGVIVPIPKGSKDSTLPDNNRGITLMPVLSKVLDTILLQRTDHWFVSKLDCLQGANRAGSSSIETAAVLQEVVAHHLNKNNSVYVTLLDIRKAFDSVWHGGLFVKLHDMGLDHKLWRLLVQSYTNFKCCVRVGTKLSSWFEPGQGVHQGDVLSMRLHSLYVNGLLEELRAEAKGTHIDTLICSHPSFADDVALAALSKSALNLQLRTAFNYSCRWRYQFAPTKTYCLVFGPDRQPEVDIVLGGAKLQVVTGHIHVGVPLYTCPKAEKDIVQQRTKACRRKFYAIEGISGPMVRLPPLTLSKLYNTVCIPAMCYGAEVWTPSDKSLQEMEKAHGQIGRSIQGLPPNASSPASHALLGWRSVEAIFDLAKLMWVLRLLCASSTSLYNKLALLCINKCRFNNTTLGHTGPFSGLHSVCLKYNLTDLLYSMMDTGVVIPKRQWRTICSRAVDELMQRRWCMTRIMYPRLGLFNEIVQNIEVCLWWSVCRQNFRYIRQCKTIVLLITGESKLNSHRGIYANGTRVCALCDCGAETVNHVMSDCDSLKGYRVHQWDLTVPHLPSGMVHSINEMVPHERTLFMCSGFRSPYIREWQEAYEAVANFMSSVYYERLRMGEQLVSS